MCSIYSIRQLNVFFYLSTLNTCIKICFLFEYLLDSNYKLYEIFRHVLTLNLRIGNIRVNFIYYV